MQKKLDPSLFKIGWQQAIKNKWVEVVKTKDSVKSQDAVKSQGSGKKSQDSAKSQISRKVKLQRSPEFLIFGFGKATIFNEFFFLCVCVCVFFFK
jgi:hypothetical protein